MAGALKFWFLLRNLVLAFQEKILQEIEEMLGTTGVQPTYQQLMEMKVMDRCIKESLRLYPSVPQISRIAAEDFTTTTGYVIPKGTTIQIPILFINRDENIWENPDKFDPNRFLLDNSSKRHPFCYIPFSAGPRNCIGKYENYILYAKQILLFILLKRC